MNQKYLGSADKLLNMVTDSGKSLQDQVLYAHEVQFGSVALLYDTAEKLGVVEIIDSVVPKRKQGASVGMYILTAAINRAVSPTSKSGLQEWYEQTCLPSITGLKASQFTPQNFWNNTDITIEQLRIIEDRLLEKENQVPELWAIRKSDYTPLTVRADAEEKDKELRSYRTKAKIFNRELTCVILYNPELEEGQLQGIHINMAKTRSELLELQGKLLKRSRGEIRKGRKSTVESVQRAVFKILCAREYMSDIFAYEVFTKGSDVLLTFSESEQKLLEIKVEQLGKTALFTDRGDLTDPEIVEAYRSAWHVESSFKQMKNTDFLTVRPIFHWTINGSTKQAHRDQLISTIKV